MKSVLSHSMMVLLAVTAAQAGPLGWDLNVPSQVGQSANSTTAAGWATLLNAPTAGFNSGFGFFSLFSNTTGVANCGFGYATNANNSTGLQNTAIGADALYWNTGSNNSAIGKGAIRGGTNTGVQTLTQNSALGVEALYDLRSGSTGNIGIGYRAGFNLQTGSNNIYIGNNSGPTSETGAIRIGTQGTHSQTILSGDVSTNGKFSTTASGIGFEQVVGGANFRSFLTTSGPGFLGMVSSHDLNLMTSNTTRMTITSGGNVGIGTNIPTRGKVEIVGFVNSVPAAAGNAFNASAFPFQFNNVNQQSISLFADLDISARQFLAPSDERIKRIEGRSNAAHDLSTLLSIPVIDYSYIDTMMNGTGKQKKVIAQQLEKVFPSAVGRITNIVPDIYKQAQTKGGWVNLSTNLKKGERVRLVGGTKESIQEVLEVAQDKFRTSFVADGDSVFVYGREVKDFRTVDYDAISMLNVSATQELARKLAAKDAELAAQKQEIAALKAQIAAKDKTIEARLALLEQQSTSGSTRAVKVAMKK